MSSGEICDELPNVKDQLSRALEVLRSGGLVAFPTETFYALGADAGDAGAVSSLLSLKSRFLGQGVSLIVPNSSVIGDWAAEGSTESAAAIARILEVFWPGPLTLVIRPKSNLENCFAPGILRDDGSLALRCSPHPVATGLAEGLAWGLTATSCNLRGKAAARSREEARAMFPDIFSLSREMTRGAFPDAVRPSTILDVRGLPFRLLREGAVPRAEIASLFPGDGDIID